MLWSQSTGNDTYKCHDTIHADSLALFALNIEILLSDVTKPEIPIEHSDFDPTCDVISDVISTYEITYVGAPSKHAAR